MLIGLLLRSGGPYQAAVFFPNTRRTQFTECCPINTTSAQVTPTPVDQYSLKELSDVDVAPSFSCLLSIGNEGELRVPPRGLLAF